MFTSYLIKHYVHFIGYCPISRVITEGDNRWEWGIRTCRFLTDKLLLYKLYKPMAVVRMAVTIVIYSLVSYFKIKKAQVLLRKCNSMLFKN